MYQFDGQVRFVLRERGEILVCSGEVSLCPDF